MAKLNRKVPDRSHVTHEGAPAKRINWEQQLRRSVCSCMLWENEFYEDGVSIAERIANACKKVKPEFIASLAIEAREKFKLRHVPLLLCRELARQRYEKTGETLFNVIQRADELTEFLAIYWKDGRCPLSAQIKKGLAKAFTKFNEYQLAKYDRDGNIKLRDVLFLCHAKPKDKEQEDIWRKLVGGFCKNCGGREPYINTKSYFLYPICKCGNFEEAKLEIPDTWEVALSAGKDKKETWERLLAEKKLGALALLRNLRNMQQVNVSEKKIVSALNSMKIDRVLPFRFIAAARYAPQLEDHLEKSMFKCIEGARQLSGTTVLLVDVSGSMEAQLSEKSDMTRMDAANGLAILLREICEDVKIFSFSDRIESIPPRRGFALRDAITTSQRHHGTYLGQALSHVKVPHDRIIVITDEQSHDSVPNPKAQGYMINVASNERGVGYGKWGHIDGFSEAVIDWIQEYENLGGKSND